MATLATMLPVMPPTILAFDTSTELTSVALTHRGRDTCWQGAGGALASATLLPRIHALLADERIELAALDAIAFGCGPGAFTGLRTACSVAQGLAFGGGKPVLAIDSLMLVAEAARAAPGGGAPHDDIGVAMDARMGELYAARYRWIGGDWQVVAVPALCNPAALPGLWGGWPRCIVGSGVLMLNTRHGGASPAGSAASDCDTGSAIDTDPQRAAALLRLALRAHTRGVGVDAALALPLYLRDKVAQTSSERAATKQQHAEAAIR